MGGKRLTLRVANERAELARVAAQVDAFCMAEAIPADCNFKLNIALEELLTNTISYGYRDGGLHQIALTIAREGDELVAEISDDARPFDPRRAAPPDRDAPPEERLLGGRGVHLVKTLMDQVDYEHRDGRNRVTLRKRIPPLPCAGAH